MIRIDYSKSIKRIEAFAKQYNEQFRGTKTNKAGNQTDDLGKMLRTPHIALMRTLMEFYAAQINDSQRIEEELKPLYTNNVALATKLSCSNRQIINQIKRLEAAKFIIAKTFRGTNADYMVSLNLNVINLLKNGNPMLVPSVEAFNEATENHGLQATQTKTFPYKKPTQNNKEIIIEGKSVDNSTDLSLNNFSHTTTSQESCSKLEQVPEEQLNRPEGETHTSTGGPREISVESSMQSIPEEHRALVELKVKMLVSFMLNFVYKRLPYMSDYQLKVMQCFFIDQFAKIHPSKYNVLFSQYNERSLMVSNWLDKDESRYIPIPQKYFDDSDPNNGWRRTKIWWVKMREDRRKYKAYQLQSKEHQDRWRTFSRAVNHFKKDQGYDHYKQAKKFLSVKYPDMAKAFDFLIVTELNAQKEVA